MKNFNDIKLYIFDLDGTLLDSMGIWNKIDSVFFAKRHLVMPDDYIFCIAHMTLEETAHYTKTRFSLEESEEAIIDEWVSASLQLYTEEVALKKGAERFLYHLHENGKQIVIATSCNEEMFVPCLKKHGIEKYFSHYYTSQNLGINKSDSRFFKKILSDFNLSPQDALIFEDSISALKCARNLGFNTVAVLDKKWISQTAELKANSDLSVTDFTSLIESDNL